MSFKNKSKKSLLFKNTLLIPILLITLAFQEKLPMEEVLTKISTLQERPPSPKGGMNEFYRYIGENYKYPKAAVDAKVEGRVLISFVVEKDGSLTEIKILRDLGYGTGEEAVRMLKGSPKWEPGMQKGEPVRVMFTLPIQLDNIKDPEKPNDNKKTDTIP